MQLVNKIKTKLDAYFRNKRINAYEKIMIQNQQLYFLNQIKKHSLNNEEYEKWLCKLHIL